MRTSLFLLATAMSVVACNSANGPAAPPAPASWSVPATLTLVVGVVDTIEVSVLDTQGGLVDEFGLDVRYGCGDAGCLVVGTEVAMPGRADGTRRYLEVRALAVGTAWITYAWLGYECVDPPMCYVKDWYEVIPRGRTQVTVVGAE